MANNILNYKGNPIGKSIEENCDSMIDDIFKNVKNNSYKSFIQKMSKLEKI